MKNYIILFACFITLFSCNNESAKTDNGKMKIVTTTQMIADVARNIAGDKAEVISLMGPGIDPHFYKATQGDLQKDNSPGSEKIWLANGLTRKKILKPL